MKHVTIAKAVALSHQTHSFTQLRHAGCRSACGFVHEHAPETCDSTQVQAGSYLIHWRPVSTLPEAEQYAIVEAT